MKLGDNISEKSLFWYADVLWYFVSAQLPQSKDPAFINCAESDRTTGALWGPKPDPPRLLRLRNFCWFRRRVNTCRQLGFPKTIARFISAACLFCFSSTKHPVSVLAASLAQVCCWGSRVKLGRVWNSKLGVEVKQQRVCVRARAAHARICMHMWLSVSFHCCY